MTKPLLAACCLSFLSACATTQSTAMVECPASGCASTEKVDPVTQRLHERASSDLACPAEQISFTNLDESSPFGNYGNGPWEAKGCGRQTMYVFRWGTVQRTNLVLAAP